MDEIEKNAAHWLEQAMGLSLEYNQGEPIPVPVAIDAIAAALRSATAAAPRQLPVPDACRSHECRRVRAEMQAEIDRLRAVPAERQTTLPKLGDALLEVVETLGSGDVQATRRFIAARTTNPEYRQDILDGGYDYTEWFGYVQAALAARQPVGQEPILRIYAEGSMRTVVEWLDGARDLPDGDYALYAAPPAQAVPEDVRRDAARLDFVLSQMAWIRTKQADSGAPTYWLETQDEDENFIRLSGPSFHRSPRAAIDAAMAASGVSNG